MLSAEIPGFGSLQVEHLVLDVNGTIADGGRLIPGVAARLAELADTIDAIAVTADTQGTAGSLAGKLGISLRIVKRGHEAEDKLALVEELGADTVVVIGNGANDKLALGASAVGICVIGPEGASRAAIEAADIVVTDIDAALGLLVDRRRLIATLRA